METKANSVKSMMCQQDNSIPMNTMMKNSKAMRAQLPTSKTLMPESKNISLLTTITIVRKNAREVCKVDKLEVIKFLNSNSNNKFLKSR